MDIGTRQTSRNILQMKGGIRCSLNSSRWLDKGLLTSVVSDTECGKVGGLKGALYQ